MPEHEHRKDQMIDAIADFAIHSQAARNRPSRFRRPENHPVLIAKYIARKARKKFGTDIPKNARNERIRSQIEFCLTATTIPIGIAITHANSMLAADKMIVLTARDPIRLVTFTW